MNNATFDVIVGGAGLSGAVTALKLSQQTINGKPLKVLLLGQGKGVIPAGSTTVASCGMGHLGFHYSGDYKTAEHCLQNTYAFMNAYQNALVTDHQSRNRRHFIMQDSMVSPDNIKLLAEYLRDVYAKLVKETGHQVFGSIEDFYKILEADAYQSYIAETVDAHDHEGQVRPLRISMGLETNEYQIDIDKLRDFLSEEIKKQPNITFKQGRTITRLEHMADELGYQVITHRMIDSKKQEEKWATSSIVLCAWQNNYQLASTIGAMPVDEHAVVRIKVSVLVEFSEPLKDFNSCLFSSGPYCSITMLGDKKAILTSERFTNIGHYSANARVIPSEIQTLLREHQLDHATGQRVANNIKEDCARYLKGFYREQMEAATIVELRTGYVLQRGGKESYKGADIYDPHSHIHSRHDSGVSKTGFLGLDINSGMKIVYVENNAVEVTRIAMESLRLIQMVNQIVCQMKDQVTGPDCLISPLLYVTYAKYILDRVCELALSAKKESDRMDPEVITEQCRQIADKEIQVLDERLAQRKAVHEELKNHSFFSTSAIKPEDAPTRTDNFSPD